MFISFTSKRGKLGPVRPLIGWTIYRCSSQHVSDWCILPNYTSYLQHVIYTSSKTSPEYLHLLGLEWVNQCPRDLLGLNSFPSSSFSSLQETSVGTVPLISWCLRESKSAKKVEKRFITQLVVQEKGLTEYLTYLCHCPEDHIGEAHSHSDSFHVGELQQQRFVLGRVAQFSISLWRKIHLHHMTMIQWEHYIIFIIT